VELYKIAVLIIVVLFAVAYLVRDIIKNSKARCLNCDREISDPITNYCANCRNLLEKNAKA